MYTVSCCLHDVQKVFRVLDLLHLGVRQFLVKRITSGVADGVVLLPERLPRRLSVPESIFQILAVVTSQWLPRL